MRAIIDWWNKRQNTRELRATIKQLRADLQETQRRVSELTDLLETERRHWFDKTRTHGMEEGQLQSEIEHLQSKLNIRSMEVEELMRIIGKYQATYEKDTQIAAMQGELARITGKRNG